MKRLALISLILVTAPVLTVLRAASADEKLREFAGNVMMFSSIFPQEKVYVQLDNVSYYTGETIWFKAYVVSAQDHHRPASTVLYVDLLSPGGSVLKTQKLRIVAGQADGSLPLLDAATTQARDLRGVQPYPSGFYEIRAYTANMLNFGEETLFSRVIPVFEKPEEDGAYYTENPIIKIKDDHVEQYRPDQPKIRENNVSVSFFPEGGHLVMGLPCRVAFKAIGSDGLGADITGTADGQEFSTIHDGMGSFTFTPTQKNSQVTINANGKEQTIRLPEAEEEGYTMNLGKSGENYLLTVRGSETLPSVEAGITVTCRNGLVWFGTTTPTPQGAVTEIPAAEIPEGVCRITVFTAEGAILCSRSFYSSTGASGPTLSVVASDRLMPFGRVGLDFTLTDENGVPFKDRFCLSIRDTRGTSTPYSDDLKTSLLLSSDLRGFIESPYYYFESSDEEHLEALDLLTLVQGWERYDWKTMAGIVPYNEIHRIEPGLTLNGWITNYSGKEPLAGAKVLAALVPPDKTQTERFTCITDENGYFGLDLTDFYEVGRLTISVETEKSRLIGTDSRIRLERSMIPQPRMYQPAETILTGLKEKAKGKTESVEEEEDYPVIIDIDRGFVLDEVDIEGKRKYIDYFRFQAFDVPKDVELELDKAQYTTDLQGYLLNKGYQVIQDSSDVLINGHSTFLYVHDSKRFLNQGLYEFPLQIDTKNIRSILVYDRLMPRISAYSLAPLYTEYLQHTASTLYSEFADAVGSADTSATESSGLYKNVLMIDVLLKEDYELSSRIDLMQIDRRATTVTGYSSPYKFYAPTYPDGPIPGDVDYRRTLYWDPNVITDENGHASVEFYGNSNTLKYNVSAAGLTAGGSPYVLDQDF